MSTTQRVKITEVQAGDRIMTVGVPEPWPGPFVRDIWVGTELVMVSTVNGGLKDYPIGLDVDVIRGQEPTGDPGEGL